MDEGFTYEYLPWRGVDKTTMQFYDVKTKIGSSGKPLCRKMVILILMVASKLGRFQIRT